MNILVSSNDRYKVPLMVMLSSFIRHNPVRDGEKHTVWLIESEMSEPVYREIEAFLAEKSADLRRLHVSGELFAKAGTRSYISRETYYRLLAGSLLPETESRVLWLDADMIARSDIRTLYEHGLGDAMAAACGYGEAMQELIERNARSLGLNDPKSYFNAGVMLLNLKALRENITEARLMELVTGESTKKYLFSDQDVLNLLLNGKVHILDWKIWNCLIHCIRDAEDLEYEKENAAIVHYAGEAKPWRFSDIHFADEWMEEYRTVFGEDAQLKRMSYFRLKALFDRQKQKERSGGSLS